MNQPTAGSIHYEICGDGFPLVILHAIGTDHRAMKAWIEPLLTNWPGWQRIYVDLPGHGQSKVEPWVRTTDDILYVLLNWLESLLLDRPFALVAKSFGGYLAQGILHKKAEQIDGLCLLAPALHVPERSLPARVTLERDEEAMSGLDPDIITAIETLLITQSRENIDSFLREVQPGRILADRAFLTSDWRTKGYFFSFEPISIKTRYPQPTLLLVGRQDAICGYQDHLALLESFPHATYSVLDRAGHMLEMEQRSIVQALFADWLKRVVQKSFEKQEGSCYGE